MVNLIFIANYFHYFFPFIYFFPFCDLQLLFFFFSSRRRHTRFKCDWSSRRVLFRSGRPGLHSARYAPEGAPAIAKLLGELAGVEDRRATYISQLVAIAPDGDILR